ncbi:MAG: TonB family protein [Crocinitomix sp.]|jgi:TonB family protein
MSQFSWSLIEINALIVLLFIGFMGIRKRLAFKLQRGLLMGIPVIAVSVIAIKSLIDFSAVSYSLPIVNLQPVIINGQQDFVAAGTSFFVWSNLYGVGVVVIGLVLIFRLVKLSLFFTRNTSENMGLYRIYKVKGKASFSFFNQIQIAPDLSAEEQDIVLEHEIMHVNKKHSIDTMILELMHVIFWFNPIFLFMKREMVNLHEYEVDALMYKKHKVHYLKFLVNYALGLNSSHYLLTSRFYNQLTLKKRIIIMKTNIRKKTWLLGIIPLIGMAAMLFQCTKQSDTNKTTSELQVDEKIYDDVEVFPKYVGGTTEMSNFIVENVNYPKEAAEEGVEGVAYVQFVVSKAGEIENVEVINDLDGRLAKEALRVVKLMPAWTPGENKGEKVGVRYTLPISFKLS